MVGVFVRSGIDFERVRRPAEEREAEANREDKEDDDESDEEDDGTNRTGEPSPSFSGEHGGDMNRISSNTPLTPDARLTSDSSRHTTQRFGAAAATAAEDERSAAEAGFALPVVA